MQYPLKYADYDFLDYNSFLCATDIKKRKVEVLAESMSKGITKIVGKLKEEHLQDVIEMVRGSKLFSNKDKRDYFG